jgi:altronate dehydratase
MNQSALKLTASDNVATALVNLLEGAVVAIADTEGAELETVTALSDIPRGHKIALRDIPAGASVVKYGCQIGIASRDIVRGAHVHTQNLGSARGRGDL